MTREERIDEVIDAITNEPKKLYMSLWPSAPNCKTPACIGGWLERFEFQRTGQATGDCADAYQATGRLIGLDLGASLELFGMSSIDRRIPIFESALNIFDEMPPARRVKLAVKILEEVKANGRACWADYFDFTKRKFTLRKKATI